MQPPPRGPAGADDPVVTRIQAWAARPTVEATISLCDELRAMPNVRGAHVDAVAKGIAQRHAKVPTVLVALGRLQLVIGKLGDAQQTLVSAGRLDPNSRTPYRLLGEVLLRRGDAQRAEKMLERAIQLEKQSGTPVPDLDRTDQWLLRARAMKVVQESQGEGAVAAEVAAAVPVAGQLTGGPAVRRLASIPPPRRSPPSPDPEDDQPTNIQSIPADLKSKLQIERDAPRAPEFPLPPSLPRNLPMPPPGIDLGATVPNVPSEASPYDRLDADGPINVVETSEIVVSDNPTLPRDTEDVDDSVPKLSTPPPHTSDPSPLPARLPLGTGPMRALRADSVTFGGQSIRKDPSIPEPDDATATLPLPGRAVTGEGSNEPPPGVPWPTSRVLDALQRAGVYEHSAGDSQVAWLARRQLVRMRRRGTWLYALVAVLLFGGIGGGLYYATWLKKKHQAEADQRTLTAEAEVRKGGIEALGNAEKELGRAFELDSRTMRGAKVWLQDRALRSFMWPSEDRREGGLASAIERAKAVGLPESEMAFARIALALSSDDTPGAAQLAKNLDPVTAKGKDDAWRELAVGWVLERAGDARAVERYSHAEQLDPELVPARLYLAKLAALAGDTARVEALTNGVANDLVPTREDLIALAILVRSGTPGKGGEASARRPSGFGWIAPALLSADPKTPAETRKKEAERAMGLAHAPADLTRIGKLAAAAGDEAIASRAALMALGISPIFAPARSLAGRLALSVGRPDDAASALNNLEAPGDPEVAALRGWLAYERGDFTLIANLLEDPALPEKSLDRGDLASIVKPLRFALAATKRGGAPLAQKEQNELKELRELGDLGPVVAFDVAIDLGEVDLAASTTKDWIDPEHRPARALRLARLARMQGKGEEADRLSKIAVEQSTVTPKALVERVLVLCALGKGADAQALLTRYPLLATDERIWLLPYAAAQAGKTAEAKKLVADLKEPLKTDPWPVRRDALLALSAAGDTKRAKDLAKELIKVRPGDPDVAAVAKSLGVDKK